MSFCYLLVGAYAQKLSAIERERLMYELITSYNEDAAWMINDLTQLPKKFKIDDMTITTFGSNEPARWLSGKKYEDVVNSLSTVVHESIHGYTTDKALYLLSEEVPDNYDFSDEYSAYYIDKSQTYLVKHSIYKACTPKMKS